nr:ribosomal protein S12 [Zea mays]
MKRHSIGLSQSSGRSGRRAETLERGKGSLRKNCTRSRMRCKSHVRFCRGTVRMTYLSTFPLSTPKNPTLPYVKLPEYDNLWICNHCLYTWYWPLFTRTFCSISKRRKGLGFTRCEISHYSRNPRCCRSKESSTRAFQCVVDSYPRLVSFDDAMSMARNMCSVWLTQ